MTSINQLINVAHQLGISLEKDFNELDSIVDQWTRHRKHLSQSIFFDPPSFCDISEPFPEYDLQEEAWIQEAWL